MYIFTLKDFLMFIIKDFLTFIIKDSLIKRALSLETRSKTQKTLSSLSRAARRKDDDFRANGVQMVVSWRKRVYVYIYIYIYDNIQPPEADNREYTNKFKYKVPVSGKLYPPLAISAYLGPPPAISVYGSPKS